MRAIYIKAIKNPLTFLLIKTGKEVWYFFYFIVINNFKYMPDLNEKGIKFLLRAALFNNHPLKSILFYLSLCQS